jgi:hypothetical protein
VRRTASSRTAPPVVIGLLLVLMATSCSSGSPSQTVPSHSPGASSSPTARGSQKVGYNPPGPPGPTVPDPLSGPVEHIWWPLLHRRACTELVAKTTAEISTNSDPTARTAAKLYRAAGEVCLGRLTAASRDVKVDVVGSGWTDCTGQPVLLQRWVRLMIAAQRGDSAARASLRRFPKVSHACVSASPSPPSEPSPSPTPSESSADETSSP